MGDYYNKTRGPLSVTLNDGSAASITPKTWLTISAANEGSASVQKLVAKGDLVRSKMMPDPVAPVAPAPVVSEAPVAEEKAVVSSAASKVERFKSR